LALLPFTALFSSTLQAEVAVTTGKTPVAGAPAITLEKVPGEVTRIEEELPKKIDEVLALVGQEAEAKRISEAAAQSLRFALRTQRAAPAGDLRGLLATARIPEDNAALKDAFAGLEVLATTVQTKRVGLLTAAIEDFNSRLAELFRTGQKPEEVDALVALIGPARDAMIPRFNNVGNGWIVFHLGGGLLDKLRSVLVAQSSDDVELLGSKVLELIHSSSASLDQLSAKGVVQDRISKIVEPLLAAVETARGVLDTAIVEQKPVVELMEALRQLKQRSRMATSLRAALDPNGRNDSQNAVEIYSRIVNNVASLERGEMYAGEALRDLRQALQRLPPRVAISIDEALTVRDRKVQESIAEKFKDRTATLTQQLEAVKDPVDLDELAVTVALWGGDAVQSENERNDFAQLGKVLSSLAAAWRAGDPQLLHRGSSGADEVNGPYKAELQAVQAQVERDIMSRVLAAPELNEPPLASEPTEAALNQLVAQLSAKGEWRRLLRLVELRQSIETGRNFQRPDDLSVAIREFLAGQNFETAELWIDAIRSYKSVLTSTSEVAPIKAAAERLKALAVEHPETVRESSH
jgi:hypothetical protein